MKHRGLLAIIFVVGCATGGVASRLVVPSARAGTNPTRWEYVCAEFEHDGRLTETLNKYGAEGWELVSVVPPRQVTFGGLYVGFCAKRALP